MVNGDWPGLSIKQQLQQQAQEQLDVALGEAQIRLTDALKRAERAEARFSWDFQSDFNGNSGDVQWV